jgi:hypothetical protein
MKHYHRHEKKYHQYHEIIFQRVLSRLESRYTCWEQLEQIRLQQQKDVLIHLISSIIKALLLQCPLSFLNDHLKQSLEELITFLPKHEGPWVLKIHPCHQIALKSWEKFLPPFRVCWDESIHPLDCIWDLSGEGSIASSYERHKNHFIDHILPQWAEAVWMSFLLKENTSPSPLVDA